MEMLWSLTRIVVISYAGLALLLYFTQDGLLYYPDLPSRKLQAKPTDIGLGFENVEFRAVDGASLHGWFLPVEKPQATLLFFHGNAGNISHRLDSLQLFNRLGLEVFIFDYRGYGNSGGEPSEAGTYLDAEAAWRYLTRQMGRSPQQIIIFGRSLGAAIAIDLASRYQARGLIIESAFLSIPTMAAELYPYLPVRWLSRYHYDNLNKLPRIKAPLLVAHSPQDEIIPYRHGRQLFSTANEPKRFLQMLGGHNDGFITTGSTYSQTIRVFIRDCLSKKGTGRPSS